MESVFDKFRQIGVAIKGKSRGTGLGLTICQGIVNRHGGSLWVNSEQGKENTFSFELPVACVFN